MTGRDTFRIVLSAAEAIVLDGWLRREVIARRCASLSSAFAHAAEPVALHALAASLQAAPGTAGGRSMLRAAREILAPEETEIIVDLLGHEDDPPLPGARPPERDERFDLARPETLVLFEFLCREVDEQKGRNLSHAFVAVGEFWALNALQNVLEPGDFYSASRDYQSQLDDARSLILKRNSP